jgi:hypothetical protein
MLTQFARKNQGKPRSYRRFQTDARPPPNLEVDGAGGRCSCRAAIGAGACPFSGSAGAPPSHKSPDNSAATDHVMRAIANA